MRLRRSARTDLAIFTGIFLSSTKSYILKEQAEQGSQDKTWEAIRVTSDGNQTLLGDQFAFLPSTQSAPPPTEGTEVELQGTKMSELSQNLQQLSAENLVWMPPTTKSSASSI